MRSVFKATHPNVKKAQQATGIESLEVIADRGYYKMEEIKATVDEGITPYVPKPVTSNNKARGLYDRRDFIYIDKDNEYQCPAGDRLIWRYASKENGLILNRYRSSNCQTCHLKSKCTPAKQRRVRRWEHGKVIEDHDRRMNHNPTMMQLRKQTAEHAFGTINPGWG